MGGKDELIYGDTVGSLFAGPFADRDKKKQQARIAAARGEDAAPNQKDPSLKKGERFLLHNLSGVVKAGEMMLVLGRPGAGATTFLKTVAAVAGGYAGVDGDVLYGDIKSTDKKRVQPIKGELCVSVRQFGNAC